MLECLAMVLTTVPAHSVAFRSNSLKAHAFIDVIDPRYLLQLLVMLLLPLLPNCKLSVSSWLQVIDLAVCANLSCYCVQACVQNHGIRWINQHVWLQGSSSIVTVSCFPPWIPCILCVISLITVLGVGARLQPLGCVVELRLLFLLLLLTPFVCICQLRCSLRQSVPSRDAVVPSLILYQYLWLLLMPELTFTFIWLLQAEEATAYVLAHFLDYTLFFSVISGARILLYDMPIFVHSQHLQFLNTDLRRTNVICSCPCSTWAQRLIRQLVRAKVITNLSCFLVCLLYCN